MEWKKGDKVLIGGKHAVARNYSSIVGEIGTYQSNEGTCHEVWIGCVEDEDFWYVQTEDLLPAEHVTNDQLTGLLKEEF